MKGWGEFRLIEGGYNGYATDRITVYAADAAARRRILHLQLLQQRGIVVYSIW